MRHTEYIRDVNSALHGEATPLTIPINVGDSSCFPWLSHLSDSFDKYRVHSLSFTYKPVAAELNPGAIATFVDYDPKDDRPFDKIQLLNSMGAKSSKITKSCTINAPRNILASKGNLYIRHSTRDNNDDILRFVDVGTLSLMVMETEEQARVVGELWVSYDISLLLPQMLENVQQYSAAQRSTRVGEVLVKSSQLPAGSNDSILGSNVSHELIQGTDGSQFIRFMQDFTGQVEVSKSGHSSNPDTLVVSPDTTALPDSKAGLRPSIFGSVEKLFDAVKKISYVAFPVLAKAGEVINLAVDVLGESDWIGTTVMRFMPASRSLIAQLTPAQAYVSNFTTLSKADDLQWLVHYVTTGHQHSRTLYDDVYIDWMKLQSAEVAKLVTKLDS